MSVPPFTEFTRLADSLLQAVPLRAPSLIVTVWGDTIAAHGATVWLGSLIRLMADFGLNERVVRTSVFRLQKDAWLQGHQVGRRSFYRLSTTGQRRTHAADLTIYADGPTPWDGRWLILVLGAETSSVREKLRRDLVFMGFGTPSPGVFARPDTDWPDVRDLLEDYGVSDDVVVFHADGTLMPSLGPLRRMVGEAWDHAALDADYTGFIEHFQPVLDLLEAGVRPAPRDAFVVRTLLIHEFRRVTLRDPLLPDSLMPRDWSGLGARRLSGALYRAVHAQATRHAMAVLETEAGGLPPPLPSYYDRFGGLDGDRPGD
ncbi:MAG: phenylacetic acid degradation operon negative regulatory protein PaaX [Pseudomonadota bacterium]|nr:phenylacetic acid degradation operon negative regulatory protein PaaX [Pseudomonadota bacterium]